MKKNTIISCFSLLCIALFSSCDQETTLPPMYHEIFSEDFSRPKNEPAFNFEDWILFSQAGTKLWFAGNYQENDYIEFSSFGSKDASNIGWAIMPVLNLDDLAQKALIFQSAQHHSKSLDNKFELLVSTDFDEKEVLSATWIPLKFRVPTNTAATNYDWVNSGKVDLSAFSGNIYIAFRVTGNGLYNSTQAGGFQVDNIKLF